VIRLKQTKWSVAKREMPGSLGWPMSAESDHTTTLLIGGEAVAGAGAPIAVENPYTTETIVTVNAASPEQVEAAVATARAAWPAWANTTAGERCELLHEVAWRLRAEAERLARTMTAEGGKPLLENRDELEWTAAAFDYYAEIGRDHAGRVIPPIESSQLAMVVKDPLGVVGCIVPWNYPLLLLAWKVAPALAAGNCVVCKPSELTPLSTLMLAGAFEHLPAGVVSLLAGAGEVGAALASHPDVDCIAFTGSVATGKKVAAACTERMARMNLEMRLGGLPQRRPGLHLGRALLRRRGGLRRLRQRLRRAHAEPRPRRPLRGRDRHRPDGLRCARRPSALSRRSSPSPRSTKRSSSPTAPSSGSAPTSTPATSRARFAACAGCAPARSGSTTR
jgi:hypothetical protein